MKASGNDADTKVAFKNCASFKKCITHINDEHVDDANDLDIVMPMYNLIEYSDNYSDTSGIYDSLKEMNYLLIMVQILTMFLQLIQHLLNTSQVS